MSIISNLFRSFQEKRYDKWNKNLQAVISYQEEINRKIDKLNEEHSKESSNAPTYDELINLYGFYNGDHDLCIESPYFWYQGERYKISNREGRDILYRLKMRCLQNAVAFVENERNNITADNFKDGVSCQNCEFRELCNIFTNYHEKAMILFEEEYYKSYQKEGIKNLF